MSATEVSALVLPDGSVVDPTLSIIAAFEQPVTEHGEVIPSAAVPPPPAGLVAEERDRARELTTQLIRAVREHDANRPRSLQRRLGPSEVGTPCLRQLAYKAAQHPPVNHGGGDPWPAFVGTATHAALEEVFARREGWATEQRIVVDADLDLAGSMDLIRLTGGVTVIDHKVVGASTLSKAKAKGPAGYYRTQVNLYAHGLIASGVPVEWVAIAYWPRSGMLSGLHVWLERYDQTVVDTALARLDVVRRLNAALGPALFGQLPVAEHYCDSCPFFRHGSTDPTVACPGADAVARGLAA